MVCHDVVRQLVHGSFVLRSDQTQTLAALITIAMKTKVATDCDPLEVKWGVFLLIMIAMYQEFPSPLVVSEKQMCDYQVSSTTSITWTQAISLLMDIFYIYEPPVRK